MFDKYKFNGSFQLLFDGTGLSNHNYNLNDNCIKKNHKNGKVSYYKYVLECKLVVGNIVISLDSEFIEKKNKNDTTFRYITDLIINNDNIKNIVTLGRNRWKIENNAFHMQKHGTFNISHMCSRNDNSMKFHYFFIQFAHTIRQLLEQGNILTKSLNLKIKEVSDFILNSLTSISSDLNHLETNFQLRFDT